MPCLTFRVNSVMSEQASSDFLRVLPTDILRVLPTDILRVLPTDILRQVSLRVTTVLLRLIVV